MGTSTTELRNWVEYLFRAFSRSNYAICQVSVSVYTVIYDSFFAKNSPKTRTNLER